jgi:threonine dehydratase
MTTNEGLPLDEQPLDVNTLRARVTEIAATYYKQFDEDPSVRLAFQPLGLEVPDMRKEYEVLIVDCSELPSASFKRLGAMTAIAEAQKFAEERGEQLTYVTAATDGNHGRAVMSVAEELGLGVSVYVPAFVDEERMQYFRDRGIEPDNSYATLEEAKQAARLAGEQSGGAYIEPFDHETTIAGNGYLGHALGAYLLENDLPSRYASVDAYVATAGGGLVAGSNIALNNLGLGTVVNLHGAQLQNCDPAARALYDLPPLEAQELDTTCTSTALLEVGQKPLLELQDSLRDSSQAFEGIEVVARRELGEAMLVYEQTYGRTGPAASLALAAAIKQARKYSEPDNGRPRLMVVVRCARDDVTDEIYNGYMSEVTDDFRRQLTESSHNQQIVREWREAEVAGHIAAFQKLSRQLIERANIAYQKESLPQSFAETLGAHSVATILSGATRRRGLAEAANRKTA